MPSAGNDDQNIKHIMEEQGITPEMFEQMSSVLGTTFAGSFRQIVIKSSLELEEIESDLKARFSLPPGHYATTMLLYSLYSICFSFSSNSLILSK